MARAVRVPAASSARLHIAFLPERLGEGTTVEFNAQIVASSARIPPPLTELDVRYPDQLGVAVGNLGAATCSRKKLEAAGPKGAKPTRIWARGARLPKYPSDQRSSARPPGSRFSARPNTKDT